MTDPLPTLANHRKLSRLESLHFDVEPEIMQVVFDGLHAFIKKVGVSGPLH